MLISMDISNFALIDHAMIEPQSGFTIITGETGAGKSLLIDAIFALRGGRVGKDSVRTGCKKATIDAVFDQVSSLFTLDDLMAAGIEPETDDTLILSREITSDGKSMARINGKLIPLSVLRDFGSRLVDIHGQNDQQVIFIPSMHLELLDRFGNACLRDVISLYAETLTLYRSCIEEIRTLGSDPAVRKRRADLLSYQISELEEANFKDGEEASLLQKKRTLSSYEKIREGLSSCLQVLGREDENSAMSQLSQAQTVLDAVTRLDPKLRSIFDSYSSALLSLESVREDLSAYMVMADLPNESLSDIETRLDLLSRYKVKYGSTFEEMCAFLEMAKHELDDIHESDKRLEELHRTRLSLEKILLVRADEVHRVRVSVADELSQKIMRELADLGMPGAIFSVSFSKRPKDRFFSRTGYDDVAFMMSANPGEPEKPLARIASGGEASRIMLAIKTILAAADETPTLIFDEIDAGISGMTATVVSQKLRMLSETHQVLCVTHMAQIAAAADQHLCIRKDVLDERTHTAIFALNRIEREEEVARLLSGERTDHKSLDLAKQLIGRKSLAILVTDREQVIKESDE